MGPVGRRWVAGIVISLSIVVAVNLLMMKLAMDSQPETAESYKNEENRK
jgi:nitrogen fixation protein FixH